MTRYGIYVHCFQRGDKILVLAQAGFKFWNPREAYGEPLTIYTIQDLAEMGWESVKRPDIAVKGHGEHSLY